MKKPYNERRKRFYYITYKGKMVKKWGKFMGSFSANEWIKKKVPMYDRINYEVEPK